MKHISLQYLRDGFSIFPTEPKSKRPAIINGGRLRWEPFQGRKPTIEELEAWFSQDGVGIAVVCGKVSGGLIVLDFDGQNFALISTEFEEKFPEIAYQTRRVMTGSGKLHIWLRCPNSPEELTRIEWKFLDLGDAAVELRANGHYVLAPPSLHPSGKPYRFLNDKPILEIPWDKMEEIIAWFDNRGKRTVGGQNLRQTQKIQDASRMGETVCRMGEENIRKAAEYYLKGALAVAKPGNRNDTGFWLACQLRDLGLSETIAEDYMRRYAEAVPQGDEPYTEAEALASLKSAYKGAPREPAIPGVKTTRKFTPSGRELVERSIEPKLAELLVTFHLTDAGNAEMFKELFGDKFRWVFEKGAWFRFDGVRWVEDTEAARVAMVETARLRGQAAMSMEDDERRAKIVKWALASESGYRLNAALSIAQAFCKTSYTEFDTDPYLLTCANGVVDLRTGQLRPAKPTDMLHKSTGIRYDPTTTCPRWERFLREVFQEDEELVDFIWRAIGYTLTGLMPDFLFICYGTGSNGKSIFLTVLEKLMGEYSIIANPAVFARQRETNRGSPSPDLAALAGARFAKCIEVRESIRLDEERVKALTGGDKIRARFLFQNGFEFYPTAKLWWSVNHKPVVRDTTHAMWRRIRLIPFEARFDPELGNWEPKEKLLAELEAELPGILTWAVKGCLEWQERGLEPVEKVKSATEEYRNESDVIERFLEECTIRKAGVEVKASELYDEFKRWAEENGEPIMTKQMFGRRMSEKGFQKEKKGCIVYKEIGLLSDARG